MLILKNKLFLFLLLFSALVISTLAINKFYNQEIGRSKLTPFPKASNPNVLGTQVPQIYISGGEYGYSSGGVITLASTDEPAVVIGGYNISGEAEVSMYEAEETALLDYLTHDKDGKQTKKNPDTGKFRYVTRVNKSINTGSYQGSKVPLPFAEKGIWYLKVKIGSTNADAFVLRSNIGVLTKEGNNEFIFWGQNFKTKRSISDGVIKIFNLQNSRKELQTVSFGAEGIAKANLNVEADIALVQQNDDWAIIPINLKYLNTGYSYQTFQPKGKQTRYFIFTDRPLYRPSDTVYFKAILRDDDDARYNIPGGEALVKISPEYDGKPVLEKSYPISADGTISGQYQLPANAKIGYYTLAVKMPNQAAQTDYWDSEWSSNSISFDVEFFRKPEFSIDVTTPKTEVIASDKTTFKISGTYFSGQPLLGQKVKYTVYSADFYEYQYLSDQQYLSQTLSSDYRYGYWYGNTKVVEGTATLNKNGEVEIDMDTKLPFAKGQNQVFSIEATIDDGSQNPAFSRRNILVYAGEYGIYRKDYSWGSKVNTTLSLPITLVSHKNIGNVSGINLTAKLHRTNWIAYQEEDKKYPSYRQEQEDLANISAKTDSGGNATFTFTPTKIGSYTITVEGKDGRGNLISKVFYAYVSDDDQPYYSNEGDNQLTISEDKQKYLPADTLRLNIFSQIPDRDVFLSLERGRVDRFQIVHLNGKSSSIDIPLVNADIPNIFAKVSSFSASTLDSNQTNVIVSPESKKIIVNIIPNSQTFGPGETVTVNVSTTDSGGNSVSSEVALWAVDKAIFELSDNKLGDIFKTFWAERANTTQDAHSLEGIVVNQSERGGGCFAAGTKVLMGNGTLKNIEDVNVGDNVLTRSEKDTKLVRAKVLKIHNTEVSGYLILNSHLKITANHILRVNNIWKEAGSIQIGDTLTDGQGRPVKIESIEWQAGKFNVYNLEIEKYHTYFADNVWVHNQKGIERSTFKDTAYWNPSIHTDTAGRAKVSFKLPDNLTTWTLAAVGSTLDTKVGQTTNEIIVSKDVIVRPILPNILRQGDEIILSALMQNFTQNGQIFDVDLQFDSGRIEQALQNIQIKSNGMEQLYWKVRPATQNDKSKLVFSARVKDNAKLADIVTQEIPVRAFGFEQNWAETGEGAKTFEVKLASDSHKEKSKVTLSLSPTIIGTLPTAMKYLINYPYGCVEQTTSRFVPAVIALLNQDLFAEALKDKDINDVIQKGLSRLSTLQQSGGGWAWWYTGGSDPFITAYVVEYLLQARQVGIKVDDELLNRAKNYLEQEKYYDYSLQKEKTYGREDQIAKNYALTLLGEKGKVRKVTDFNNLGSDLLSLAVMTNYLNGDKNPQTNGLVHLASSAQPQGEAVFWQEGQKLNFGSKDASTALAIRAIMLAGGDRNLAVKGAKYLTRSRQTDYWSNTFATAQVIRALVDFSKITEELTPNYTYIVSLDGKQVAQGTVSSSKRSIGEINIPVANIKSDGSKITIVKNGDGQIYSTLKVDEFRTDKNAEPLKHGLSVRREYVNEKGAQYSLGIGDTVIVKTTVGGLRADANYGVIKDELPSGLVPINESFKNEQYGYNPNTYYTSYDVTDREITENGMVLSLYQIESGERTYTYRARVVSEGTFLVPPVTASLMYAPEIYGRSDVQTIKIGKLSQFTDGKDLPKTLPKTFNQKTILIGVSLFIVITGIVLFVIKRKFDDHPDNGN